MKALAGVLIFLALVGCSVFGDGKGPDYSSFVPHVCKNFRKTPKGYLVCNDPKDSIAKGYATNAEVDKAVDAGWDLFRSKFPELASTEVAICTTDDYVLWVGQWAAGACSGRGADRAAVCLWSRGTSSEEPKGVWIKRPPGDSGFGESYSVWRFTARPLVPALAHEALHVAIGDPNHASPLWQRLK